MQVGHRLVAGGVAAAVVASVVVLPVVTGPQATVHAVQPVVTELALHGIDPVGLRSSSAPVPEPSASRAPAAASSAPKPKASAATTVRPVPTVVAPLAPAVITAATTTRPFSLVGVDWSGPTPAGTTVQVRVHEDGVWSDWSSLDVAADHGPDAGDAEAAGVRTGTEPLMTSIGSDGVQVRIDSAGGVAPADARITLVDPRSSAADAAASPTPLSTAAAAGDPLRPAIITRAQWGADESLRNSGPVYTGPIKVGFVHHTASTTNYTPAQATAQVRALYAWFTLGLHYSDLAYNFLVDRYGRLYEGRAGGMDRNVLGGHTAGFNQNTFAVSAIGNFDTYRPTTSEATAMSGSIARLMAWKLALNHANPLGTATLVSSSAAGTSRFAVGTKATVPVISGHRDIGSTACPGRYLESLLPRIRTLAKADMGTQLLNPSATPGVSPYGAGGTVLRATTTTKVAWKLEVFSVCQAMPVRVLTGTQSLAGPLAVTWDQRRSDGKPALPGAYRLVLSASNGAAVAYPADVRYVVTATPTAPLGPCAEAARLAQTERYAAAVEAGRLAAPTSRVVVLAPGGDADLPEALIAAPLAAVKGAPRLLTTPTALPVTVAADITSRRATTAYLVGTPTQIGPGVESQLRSLGVATIVRLTGTDHATIAAAVARAMAVRGSAVAVSFDAGASLDVATAAATDAASARRPLVVVTRSGVPASTTGVLTALGITSVTVAAATSVVPDSVVATVPGARRVAGADDTSTAAALVGALAPAAVAVAVLPVGQPGSRAVAAGSGRPLLLVPAAATATTSWLTAHPQVRHALVVGSVADATIGAWAAAIATSSTAAAPVPKPAPNVPASFTFNGAGSGHGVGMSQWGARGMALEGATAAQIVQHYYSGTTVAPVTDAQDIRVNLLHQKPAVVFRAEPLATGGGGIEVTVAGRPAVVGTKADVFVATAANGIVQVTRTRAGSTTLVGTGRSVVVRWAGTRTPGRAGGVATLLNVSTSIAGLTTPGHRYRYGFLDLAATTTAPARLEAVNSVRIHDEYLLGIGEMTSSWPAAALQAQVLASRSYALTRYGTGAVRADCRCQVDNGQGPYHDQAFVGWSKESGAGGASWRSAVASTWATPTTGRAVLSAGRPVAAYYFAASGGRTQSSQDVWVTRVPYAQSVDDHWSMSAPNPWRAWIPRVRTQAQVAAAFGLPDVARIDLSSRTAGGGVRTAVAWSSTGASASISGEALRGRLSLPGTWVSRTAVTASGDAVTIAAASAHGSTTSAVVLAPVDVPAMVAVATSLAARKGVPLLLTTRDRLSAATRAELVRRAPTTVYAVGTATEMPSAVVAAIDTVSGTVVRVTGTTDSAVSVAAANLVALARGGRVLVAAANDAVPALLAAGVASATRRPLLLVPGGTATSSVVSSYLAAHAVAGTTVVGSTTTIPAKVLASLRAATRVSGADATDTSVRLAALTGAPASPTVTLATANVSGVVAGLVAGPGTPVVVVGASLGPATARLLQSGVTSLVVAPGVFAAVATAARNA